MLRKNPSRGQQKTQNLRTAKPERKPNVVFILADNAGWGDWSAYGGQVPTPRIDALAAEGIRFTNYSVQAQCTPTRSAILTGRMPISTGNNRVPFPGEGKMGLAPWEYTMAELLSKVRNLNELEIHSSGGQGVNQLVG